MTGNMNGYTENWILLLLPDCYWVILVQWSECCQTGLNIPWYYSVENAPYEENIAKYDQFCFEKRKEKEL